MIHYRVPVLTGSSGKLKIKSDLQKDTPFACNSSETCKYFFNLFESQSFKSWFNQISLSDKQAWLQIFAASSWRRGVVHGS